MQDATLLQALILGVVEGLTEFLPVSSTGHLILAGELLGFNDERGKVFHVVIQTGAMLAVLWEYRARLFRLDSRLWRNLAVAFLPAALAGLAFGSLIKAHLFKPEPVALAFIAGGLIILWVERRGHPAPRVAHMDEMTWLDALKVGAAQCFALIPGTSRSGATIIGGMLFGLSRGAATEFSFFLAVPTLVAAGGYDFYTHRALFVPQDLGLFAVGSVAAFAAAFLCVRWLIRFVATHDFRPFAWYRIAFGLVVLATAYGGWVDWSRA
jgi:undecaprenyl-diphosphatase